MIEEKIVFEEKQYLGFNRLSMMRRLVLAIFCFAAYFWANNPKPVEVSGVHIGAYPAESISSEGELFFLLGIIILVISAGMIFILHLKTTVSESCITLDSLWTSKKVKIVLRNIIAAQVITYSKYNLKRPVYNLHFKGRIRFFTHGNEAVELQDKDGLVYRIGSQKAFFLCNIIRHKISSK